MNISPGGPVARLSCNPPVYMDIVCKNKVVLATNFSMLTY